MVTLASFRMRRCSGAASLLSAIILLLGSGAVEAAPASLPGASPPVAGQAESHHDGAPDGAGPGHAHGENPEDGHAAGESVQKEHDHADHGDGGASETGAFVAWIGRLHPMIVHFPIALLVLAALAELIALFGRGPGFGFAARFCLWGGALAALVAAPLGWLDALSVQGDYSGFSGQVLFYHRWLGVVTALVAGLALFACERFHRGQRPRMAWLYRGSLFLSALLVSVAGHLGASLIYGWEYLSW